MSFTIPYLFSNPWCETYLAGYVAKRVGLMRIAVLNELNHPVVPVPPVYINVWAMAGPDFQLARPSSERLPLNLWTPVSLLGEEEFVAQGLTRDAIRDMPAPSLIPASGAVEHNICNADEIVHIKELIMRPQWLGTLAAATQPLWQQFFITPFNPVKRLPGTNVSNNGYYDYFRMIYRYTRGSFKLAFLQTVQGTASTWTDTQSIISNVTSQTDGGTIGTYLPYIQNVGAVGTSAIISNSTGNGASYCQQKGMPQVATIPYYSTMYGITNAAWYGGMTPSLKWNVYGTSPAAQVVCRLGGDLLLMAGDDMELVFLVGAPALSTGTR
jgi:hypothetical protein